jgi:hypothetical protein
MSLPGFTAEQSLVRSSVEYHSVGAGTPYGVSPEGIGITDAWEHITHGIQEGLQTGLPKLGALLKGIGGHPGDPGTSGFDCFGFATNLFRCNGTSAVMTWWDVYNGCVSAGGADGGFWGFATCSAIAGAAVPLMQEYCKSPGADTPYSLAHQLCG